MDLLTNGLLIAATLFAGGYCWVLARRVQALKSLDSGLGGAIVTLTRQIELARTTLDEARASSRNTHQDLTQLVAKAEGTAGQLRILIAAAPVPAPRAAAPAPLPQPQPQPEAAPAAAPVVAIRPAAQPQPQPEPAPRPQLAEVPKPRALSPVENPLRRREPAEAPAVPSEDDLIEALSALAGGR